MFPGLGQRKVGLPALEDARRIAELERKVGQLTTENDVLKNLTAFQGSSPTSRSQWRGCLFEEIRCAAKEGKTIIAFCAITGLTGLDFIGRGCRAKAFQSK
jgi:hypothetical protein